MLINYILFTTGTHPSITHSILVMKGFSMESSNICCSVPRSVVRLETAPSPSAEDDLPATPEDDLPSLEEVQPKQVFVQCNLPFLLFLHGYKVTIYHCNRVNKRKERLKRKRHGAKLRCYT